jgi:tRNA pseudouridine55 synthase
MNRPYRRYAIDGILNLNKSQGMTSSQAVALIRKWSGERKVGHGGTLDPEATGVLPICLGQATRVVEFLNQGRKVYRAQVELGTATDTYDASGRVTSTGDPSAITEEQITIALASFQGYIEQLPPMFSAIKHQGKPLYRLARAGIEVPRERRWVNIFHIELLQLELPIITIKVECGKGTYIRSLAHDLGQALGCPAHLKSLTRLRSGPFTIDQALTLSQVENAFREGYWPELFYPLDEVLLHLSAIIVGPEREQAITNGRPLLLAKTTNANERCRAYSLDGHIIALLRFHQGRWQPEKVFIKA